MFNFFSCSHRKIGRPFTEKDSRTKTRVVCLDCGTAFHYDLDAMKIGKEIPRPEPRMTARPAA